MREELPEPTPDALAELDRLADEERSFGGAAAQEAQFDYDDKRCKPGGNQLDRNNAGYRWWFDLLIDIMLAEPELSLEELGKRCNRSPNYISMVRSSDMFKARFALRRAQFNKEQAERIGMRLTRVAELGLDTVIDRLERRAAVIKTADVIGMTNSALDRLGFAPKKESNAVQVNVNTSTTVAVPVSREALEEARQQLRDSQVKQIEGKRADAE